MWYAALLLGLASSLHCVGMCGPMAMLLPLNRRNRTTLTVGMLQYHLGRLLAYSFMGLLFGLLGRGLYVAGLQQKMAVITGLVMIALALLPENTLLRYRLTAPLYRVLSWVKKPLAQRLKQKDARALILLGTLNGFLPCGLVYAALFGALAMENVLSSGIFMALFGLGTIPLMSLAVYAQDFLSTPWRRKLQRLVPLALGILGFLFVLRGMGLGFGFSPDGVGLFVKSGSDCF